MILTQLTSLFVVHAADDWGGCLQGSGTGAPDVATFTCLEPLFKNVIQAIIALAGVALFIMFLIGGFSFLFSGGDPKKLESARGTITNAIIGLIVIVAAYIILRIIEVFTGVPVTKFGVTIPQ